MKKHLLKKFVIAFLLGAMCTLFTVKMINNVNHSRNLIENRIRTDISRANDSTLIKNNFYKMIGE